MAEIGQVIAGRYRLLELRGEDAISATFRAKDNQGGGDVAVRVLVPDFGADPDFVAEFRLQMRAAMGLSHPNVLELLDFGVDGDEVYIVNELLNGQELGALLQRNGPVPPRRAATVTMTVARAVEAAHERGIVHAGLRSGCVYVARDGQIKIADFGIARAVSESGMPVDRGVEELWYLSPEQLRGRRATDASDAYALGVLLFELLTGRGPWDGSDARQIAAARTAEPLPLASDFQDGIPEDLLAIDRKAMAPVATDRFDSAVTLAEALDLAIAAFDRAPAPRPQPARATAPADEAPVRPVVPPVVPPVLPPTRPVLPPATPRPQPPVQRRPNPTMAVGYPADAYADAEPVDDEEPLPEPPRRRAAAYADGSYDRADRMAAPARAPRRINPGDSAPDSDEEEEPVSMWAWVAAFLALFLVTLLGLTMFLLLNRNSTSNTAVYAPDLGGQTFSQAQQTVQAMGLQVAIKGTQKNDGSQTDNTIVDQNPAVGASMNRGDTIYVTIVSGTGQAVVPSIVGLTESEAVNSLTSAHLKVGNRSDAYDPTVPEGQVVSTNPRAGISVAEGSPVDYVVSKGPEPTAEPTPTPSPTPSPTPAPTPTPTPAPTAPPAPTPTPTA